QLTHEKCEALLERLADRAARVLADRPHPALERTDRFLPCLVDELLLSVIRLPFFGRVLTQPRVHLSLELRRKFRMLVNHVLKIGREMDFARADARERIERVGWQRRRAVLHGAGEAVVVARRA